MRRLLTFAAVVAVAALMPHYNWYTVAWLDYFIYNVVGDAQSWPGGAVMDAVHWLRFALVVPEALLVALLVNFRVRPRLTLTVQRRGVSVG